MIFPARSDLRVASVSASAVRAWPNRYDCAVFLLLAAILVLIVHGAQGMGAPLARLAAAPVTLDPANLPEYALRTTLRMFAAIVASLLFTFVVATLAAKSRKAELVIIPALDILQSVPVLGFLTFTVVFFMGLFPGSQLGAEVRGDLRDLHEPGLEHGLQLLPVAAHRAARPRRGHAGISSCRRGCASGGSRCRSPRRA